MEQDDKGNTVEEDVENYDEFTFSPGWLYNFKARQGLAMQRLSGEAGSTDPKLVEPERERLREITRGYATRDIHNCDKTAFL